MKTTIILSTVIALGLGAYQLTVENKCKGLSDAYCSLADSLYAKHGTKSVYDGVRDYSVNGAKSSGIYEAEFNLNDLIDSALEAKKILKELI